MAQTIGPYRVEERLGVGGMGEVYKAYDDRLDRWVAIKRIRTDKEEADDNRERFRREARATARLNHSAIVHLYDIFHDGDSDCIVMEYVEGERLDKLVMAASLAPAQVARLGQEIASGLSEAHSKGILHRDLKVENVIVTPEGHAKILDFGLAKPMLKGDLDASLTGKGQLVGTSRAMAPEYIGGEPVDHRSDLFSLGVLLYEAATGHSPFKSHNTLATLKQVMLYHQTPAHQLSSQVPPDFSDLIDRLLEKDPDDRPQSAEDVALECGRLADQLSSSTFQRPDRSGADASRPGAARSSSGATLERDSSFLATATATAISLDSRRRWPVLAMILVAFLGAAVALRWWPRDRPPAEGVFNFEERDRIVVADFENKTGETILDDSVDFAFRVGLEQSQFARVLPRPQISDVLLRMERDPETPVDRDLGIEICRREGAKALVSGSIVKIGEAYTLTGSIADPQSGTSIFTTTARAADRNGIVSALEEVTLAIRTNLGESLRAIEETRALEQVTTGNLEALKAYTLAVAKIETGEDEEAVQLFEQAVKLDPRFAMAYAKLGAYWIYYDPSLALEYLDTAAGLSERLNEKEKLYVEGWVARVRGTPREELRAWSLLRSLYPDDYTGHFNVGLSSWYTQYRFSDAAEAFLDAVEVASTETLPRIFLGLGFSELGMGDIEKALASFDKAAELNPWDAVTDAHIALRSYPQALSLIEDHLGDASREAQIMARLKLAQYHADQASLEKSVRAIGEAEKLAREEGDDKRTLTSLLSTAACLTHLGRDVERRGALDQATTMSLQLLEAGSEGLEPLSLPLIPLLGKLEVRASSIGSAETLLAKIKPIAENSGYAVLESHVKMLEGELLSAQGRHEEAVERIRDAVAVTHTFQAHESLARAHEELGQTAAAITEHEWLIANRGRAVVECNEADCQILSLIDWAIALHRLGRLQEQSGNTEAAIASYRRFLDHWQDAQELAIWQDAQSRLEALTPHRE